MPYQQVETIKDLKDKVLYCLENIPATRNDDVYLTWSIIWTYRRYYIIQQDSEWYVNKRILHAVREDHVKRIRAKIQNEDGKFLPTDPAVRRKRKVSEEAWRSYLGANPEMRTL